MVAAVVATGLLTGASEEFLQHHHADSLLYSLASLQHWTPFYWGQDRLGMFYALPAVAVADPLWNLWTINVLTTVAGLAGLVLAGWYAFGRRLGVTAGLLAGGVCIALPTYAGFVTFLAHPEYLGALAPAVGALLLAEARDGGRRWAVLSRWVAALVLMGLAVWVNLTIVAFLGPMVVFRRVWRDAGLSRREGWLRAGRGFAMLVAGAGVGMALPRLLVDGAGVRLTSYAFRPVGSWPGGWWALLREVWEFGAGVVALPASVAVVGLLVWVCLRRRRGRAETLQRAGRGMGVLLVSAGCWFLVLGTLEHVASPGFGGFNLRYLTLSIVFMFLAGLGGLTGLLESFRQQPGRGSAVAVGVLLLAGAVLRYGLPSQQRVIDVFEARLGPRTREVLAEGCTHVTGHYWLTIDTVWYANLLLHRHGEDRVIYAITDRAYPTYRYWRDRPVGTLRVGSVDYDWQEDMYGLTTGQWFPAIDPEPVKQGQYIRIMRFKDSAR